MPCEMPPYVGLYVVTLGGHHHGGDLINPLFIHKYFTYPPYNTVLILDSNRLEKLPSITIDMAHAIVRSTDFSLANSPLPVELHPPGYASTCQQSISHA